MWFGKPSRKYKTISYEIRYSSEGKNKCSKSINHVNREITLGAAISILVNTPNSCRNANEHIDSISIVQEILKNEKHWFKDTERKLSEAEMVQLINEYLKFSKPLYLNKI